MSDEARTPLELQAVFARSAPGGVGDADRLQGGLASLIREWLLLLLRFAITRDPRDEVAALIMAREIDCLGRQLGRSAPTFFRRSSSELCKAVAGPDSPEREVVLRRHLARIEDPRIKSALQAAVRAGGSAGSQGLVTPPN
jgi:hypothetical protein